MDFFRFLIGFLAVAVAGVAADPAVSQIKTTTLLVTPEVQDTGVVKFMLPRFTLKHGVRVTVVDEGDASGSLIADGDTVVFSRGGTNYGLTVHVSDDPHMSTLAAWLTGDVGRRTILSFKQDGLTQFVLVRDNMECCFGPGAALYDCIMVQMQPGESASYSVRPVTVEGNFKIQEWKDFDGVIRAIYHLDGKSVY